MNNKAIAITVGAILAAGCAQVSNLLSDNVTLTVTPQVVQSGYTTQTDISQFMYTLASIATMDVKLYTIPSMGAATASEALVTGHSYASGAFSVIHFSNLHHNTIYRMRAIAHKADGSQISVDASSSVDLTVGTSDNPSVQLQCKLADPTFNGAATSSINISNSVYNNSGSETIN